MSSCWRCMMPFDPLKSLWSPINGTPLQYSCLENPTDGEVCRLQSTGSQRVGLDWVIALSLSFTFYSKGTLFNFVYSRLWINILVITSTQTKKEYLLSHLELCLWPSGIAGSRGLNAAIGAFFSSALPSQAEALSTWQFPAIVSLQHHFS